MLNISSIIEECTENLQGYEAYLIGKILDDIYTYCKRGDIKWLRSADGGLTQLIEHLENDESSSPAIPNSASVSMREFNPASSTTVYGDINKLKCKECSFSATSDIV